MNWKFWRQNRPAIENNNAPKKKPIGPKELPQRIGQYLVTKMNMDPDAAWSLRYLSCPVENTKSMSHFRIYNPVTANAAGLRVKAYESLDSHPDLILFHGRYDKQTYQIEIEAYKPRNAA